MQITHADTAQGQDPSGLLIDGVKWNKTHTLTYNITQSQSAPTDTDTTNPPFYSKGDIWIQQTSTGLPIKTSILTLVTTTLGRNTYTWTTLSEGVTVVSDTGASSVLPPLVNSPPAINYGIGDIWCRAYIAPSTAPSSAYNVNSSIVANAPSYVCTNVDNNGNLSWVQIAQVPTLATSGTTPTSAPIGTYSKGQMYFITAGGTTTAYVLTAITSGTAGNENYTWSQITGGGSGGAGVSSIIANGSSFTGAVPITTNTNELSITQNSGVGSGFNIAFANPITMNKSLITTAPITVSTGSTPSSPEFNRNSRRIGTWAYKNSTGTASQSIPAMTQGGGPTRLNQWLSLTWANYANDLAFIKAQTINGEAGLSVFRNISNNFPITIFYQISVTLGNAYSPSYVGASSYVLGCAGRGWTSGIIRQDDVAALPAQLINLTREEASVLTNASGVSGFDSVILSLSGMYVVMPTEFITFFVAHTGNTITIPGPQSGGAFGQFDTGNVIRLTIYECI